MKVVTSDQMKRIDSSAMNDFGIAGPALMELAGFSVYDEIRKHYGDLRSKRVGVFCGQGNNGGDGFVVARHLTNNGARVKIYFAGDADRLPADAAANYRAARAMNLEIAQVSEADLQKLKFALSVADLIVDALLGTGIKGPLRAPYPGIIEAINSSGKPVVSVDLPSGLDSDTGQIHTTCVRADLTVTFAYPKVGLYQYPGAAAAGQVVVRDIGIPEMAADRVGVNVFALEPSEISCLVPARPPDGHKGTFGHVFVVGGSPGYSGAVRLAGLGALRSGAGLVTVGIPSSISGTIETGLVEAMKKRLPDTEDGLISDSAAEEILEFSRGCDSFVIGPGLRTGAGQAIRRLVSLLSCPAVVDADGLNSLASYGPEEIEKIGQQRHDAGLPPLVLTPHPGEMARLSGMSVAGIQSDRVSTAREYARRWRCVLVLKGARTVTASPDGRAFINLTGNSSMAVGGSGDVLSGLIAGLAAQGLDPVSAAVAGVYVHGLAGEIGSDRGNLAGILAGEIAEAIPRAFSALRTSRNSIA